MEPLNTDTGLLKMLFNVLTCRIRGSKSVTNVICLLHRHGFGYAWAQQRVADIFYFLAAFETRPDQYV